MAINLPVIVVINKIDKPAARCDWAVDQVFDLFVKLNAPDELLDFVIDNILLNSVIHNHNELVDIHIEITHYEENSKNFIKLEFIFIWSTISIIVSLKIFFIFSLLIIFSSY